MIGSTSPHTIRTEGQPLGLGVEIQSHSSNSQARSCPWWFDPTPTLEGVEIAQRLQQVAILLEHAVGMSHQDGTGPGFGTSLQHLVEQQEDRFSGKPGTKCDPGRSRGATDSCFAVDQEPGPSRNSTGEIHYLPSMIFPGSILPQSFRKGQFRRLDVVEMKLQHLGRNLLPTRQVARTVLLDDADHMSRPAKMLLDFPQGTDAQFNPAVIEIRCNAHNCAFFMLWAFWSSTGRVSDTLKMKEEKSLAFRTPANQSKEQKHPAGNDHDEEY